MSKVKRIASLGVTLAVAAAGGGFASVALERWSQPAHEVMPLPDAQRAEATAPRPKHARSAAAPRPHPLMAGVASKLSDIESRVDGLERAETGESSPQPPPEPPPASFYHERHAETVNRHLREPVDQDWGPATTVLVEEDIAAVAQAAGFTTQDVECRSESCRVVLRWDRLETARENLQQLSSAPLRANCERTLVLPEAEAGDSVEATLVLNCAGWRAEGSTPFPVQELSYAGE